MYQPPTTTTTQSHKDANKLAKYRRGEWQCPPPPVYTGNWDETSWIRFIDAHGKWTKPATKT